MSANFLVADDYRLKTPEQSPLTRFDEVVGNEKQEFLVHELLFILLDTAIHIGNTGTGSIKTIVNTDETSAIKLTKRLGEVDYTEAEVFTLIYNSSANRNKDINTDDSDELHIKKGIKISTSSLSRVDLRKVFNHCRGPLVIKKLGGKGVPFINFTAFLPLEEFSARTDTAA